MPVTVFSLLNRSSQRFILIIEPSEKLATLKSQIGCLSFLLCKLFPPPAVLYCSRTKFNFFLGAAFQDVNLF